MTEKRFWILNTLTKCSGIKDKDKLLTFDEVVDLLNELNDENTLIKTTIKEAYQTERTHIGRSVLKQVLEQME